MSKILKVTALMSSVSVLMLLFNFVKTKAIALLAGPAGVGLYGLFMSMYTTVVSLTSITSGGSVVKAVAEANKEKSASKLKYLKDVLTTVALIIGFIVSVVFYFFSEDLSKLAFDSDKYKFEISVMGFVIIFAILSNLMQSWLNALRYVKEIAKTRLYSTITVTGITVIVVFFKGIDGVIYSIITLPIITFSFSTYFFSKKVIVPKVKVTLFEHKDILKNVFKIGLVLLLISVLFQLGVFVNRNIISNKMGIESLGIFFAAWTISISYIEIILSSLSVDFYPKLVEHKDSDSEMIDILNDQLFISLLISFPIIAFVFVYSEFVIQLLYSKEFLPAVEILKWQMAGDIFKVCAYIGGYVFIVKNFIKYSLLFQIIWVTTYTSFIWFGLDWIPLDYRLQG